MLARETRSPGTFVPPEEEERLIEGLASGRRALPHLLRPLRPYQARGAVFAAAHGRAILADEMGLGKTLQAIAAALLLAQHAGVRKALVLCPASHVRLWLAELARSTDLPSASLEGAGDANPFFVVAPLPAAWRERRELASSPPDLVVIDEAWRLTRWDGRLGRALLGIRSPYVLVLTGTPFEADIEWLRPVAQWVSSDLFPDSDARMERHLRVDDRGSLAGYRHLDELGRRLSAHLLRRRTEDVACDLPAVVESTVPLPDAGRSAAQGDALPRLAELHHVLRELCLANGHRAVVLAQDRALVCAAAPLCERLRIGYACLWNRLSPADEKEVARQFLLHPELRVFLTTDGAVPEAVLRGTRHRICLDAPRSRTASARRSLCDLAPAHRVQIASQRDLRPLDVPPSAR